MHFLPRCLLFFFAFLPISPAIAQIPDSLVQQLSLAPDDTGKVNLLNEISKSLVYKDVRSGMAYALSARDLAVRIGFKKGLAYSCYLMGHYHRFQGNLDSSEAYFSYSGKLFRQLNLGQGESLILSAMAGLYQDRQQYNQSLALYFEALKTDRQLKDQRGESIDLLNIALVFAQLKRYKEAEEYFLQSARLKLELGDDRGVAFVYVNLGSMLVDQQKWEEAAFYLEKAYADQKDQMNTRLLAVCQMDLGSVYVHQGKYREAEEMELAAISFYEQTADSSGLATAYNLLGRVYLYENKLQPAGEYYMKALHLLKDAQNNTPLNTTYQGLYEVSKRRGDYGSALTYLEELQKINARTYQLSIAQEITSQKEKYEAEKREARILLLEEQSKNAAAIAQKQRFRFILLAVSGGAVFIILSLVIVLIIIRYSHLKKIRSLELMKTRAELEQKLLRAQMNPHFIFNALNSIQHYVLTNQADQAYDYLASFSSLIRQVLSNSEHSTITLSKELAWLKTYVELEQMRFNKRFVFELKCDEELLVRDPDIPVMLIQPFVENALWHGIMNLPKDKTGLLRLSVVQKDAALIITVEDNGIGRVAASELKKNDAYASVGILFTRKRLEMLKWVNGTDAQVEVADLYDTAGRASGTRVDVILHL